MSEKEIAFELWSELKEIYFLYYFAVMGMRDQHEMLGRGKAVLRRALEAQYGTSQSYVNTVDSYMTIADQFFPFPDYVMRDVSIHTDLLIASSSDSGKFGNRLRENVVVLMAATWEKYRPRLIAAGASGDSDFWGSVHKVRNALLHNKGRLNHSLYDKQTFSFLKVGEEIVISNSDLGAIFVKAHDELFAVGKA